MTRAELLTAMAGKGLRFGRTAHGGWCALARPASGTGWRSPGRRRASSGRRLRPLPCRGRLPGRTAQPVLLAGLWARRASPLRVPSTGVSSSLRRICKKEFGYLILRGGTLNCLPVRRSITGRRTSRQLDGRQSPADGAREVAVDEQRDQGDQEYDHRAARPADQAGGAVGGVVLALRGQQLVCSSRWPGQVSALLFPVALPRHANCAGLRSTE